MATVDVIRPGFADMELVDGKQLMRASGSSCLILTNSTKILFDTFGPCERQFLINELAKRKIAPDDIDYLVCSHSHPDHVGNLNLFTSAKLHIVGTSVYEFNLYHMNKFEPIGSFKYKVTGQTEIDVIEYEKFDIDPKVSVIPTFGHTMECVSVIVDDNQSGKIALVGDLFERAEDVQDQSIWLRAGSQNPDIQRANRAKIYNQVDLIMPGHGPMFKALNFIT